MSQCSFIQLFKAPLEDKIIRTFMIKVNLSSSRSLPGLHPDPLRLREKTYIDRRMMPDDDLSLSPKSLFSSLFAPLVYLTD